MRLLPFCTLVLLATLCGGQALADDDTTKKCDHIQDPSERAKCIVEANTNPPPVEPPAAAVTLGWILGVLTDNGLDNGRF